MKNLGSDLTVKIPQYTAEELCTMFGATTQVAVPEIRTPEQINLSEQVQATKPTADFLEEMIKSSWNVPLMKCIDSFYDQYISNADKVSEVNKKILVMFQVYPELLDKTSMLETLIRNCYDMPNNKKIIFLKAKAFNLKQERWKTKTIIIG